MGATLISSNKVTMDVLSDIQLPNKTHSYVPVSHIDFIKNTKDIANRVLNKHQLHTEQYGIARDGKQMFGTLTYKESFREGQNIASSRGSFRVAYNANKILGITAKRNSDGLLKNVIVKTIANRERESLDIKFTIDNVKLIPDISNSTNSGITDDELERILKNDKIVN